MRIFLTEFVHHLFKTLTMNWYFWKKKDSDTSKETGYELDGVEEYQHPLPIVNISYFFCRIKDLKQAKYLQMIAEELSVTEEHTLENIAMLTDGMIENATCIIEYPYVDEAYRDAYYTFYSRKHYVYNRNCFRISFFTSEVNEENFYDVNLTDKYLGYTVLQPTPKCIIGYTFLHPTIYKDCNFCICLCQRDSFIMGRKVTTMAFPYSGQDGEFKSCAENAIYLMCDYFSRKYNRYAQVLPSHIGEMLTDCISGRQQPTHGADIDTVVSILNLKGLTTRKYDKVNEDDIREFDNKFAEKDFLKILSIYVDSGFPIYVSNGNHAFLIIGKKDGEKIDQPIYVCIDDNTFPYSYLTDLKDIISFVVPVSENILVDAPNIDPDDILSHLHDVHPDINWNGDTTNYYHRIFLTTSRSYKSYVVKAGYHQANRELIIDIAMPKFIWVTESLVKEKMRNQLEANVVDAICVLDATDALSANNRLLMVKTKEKLLIPTQDRSRFQHKIYAVNTSTEVIHPFMNNLKGKHLQWKES